MWNTIQYVHFKETNRLFSYTWADGQAHTQPVIGGNFVSVSALAYRLARVAPLSQRMLLQWWNHWRPERAAQKTNSWCFCATFGPDSSGSKYSLRWDRQYEKAKSKERRFAQKWEARASSSQTVFTQTQVAYTIHFSRRLISAQVLPRVMNERHWFARPCHTGEMWPVPLVTHIKAAHGRIHHDQGHA